MLKLYWQTDQHMPAHAGAGMLTLIAPWVNIQFLGSSLTFMMVRTWLPSVKDAKMSTAAVSQLPSAAP